jgi:hypothetical protein
MEQNQNQNVWLVVFGVGDSRTDHYGWMAFYKEDATKTEARKAGDRAAKRKGENSYNYYYCKHTTYVTDSISAFMKKCAKVGLNPSRECLKEYGFEID